MNKNLDLEVSLMFFSVVQVYCANMNSRLRSTIEVHGYLVLLLFVSSYTHKQDSLVVKSPECNTVPIISAKLTTTKLRYSSGDWCCHLVGILGDRKITCYDNNGK